MIRIYNQLYGDFVVKKNSTITILKYLLVHTPCHKDKKLRAFQFKLLDDVL